MTIKQLKQRCETKKNSDDEMAELIKRGYKWKWEYDVNAGREKMIIEK